MSILARMLERGSNVTAKSTLSLQDTFLKHLSDNNVDVTIFLGNGIRLQGRIERFDNFIVLLVRGNSSQVVYKHAISTILPAEPVELLSPSADANG